MIVGAADDGATSVITTQRGGDVSQHRSGGTVSDLEHVRHGTSLDITLHYTI